MKINLAKLPEKWVIKANSSNYNELQDIFNTLIGRKPVDKEHDSYYHYPQDQGVCTKSCIAKDYTEIIIEQLRFSIDLEEKVEEKVVIGYKVPYDMPSCGYKKDQILTKSDNPDFYNLEKTGVSLPKEVVEGWEQVLLDKYKIGDWVVIKYTDAHVRGYDSHREKIVQISYYKNEYRQVPGEPSLYDAPHKYYVAFDNNTIIYSADEPTEKYILRKATKEEIDSVTSKTLILGSNNKTVKISKGSIIIEGYKERINYQYLKKIYDDIIQLDSTAIGDFNLYFTKDIRFIRIGCTAENNLVSLHEIKQVLNMYKMINK